VLYRLIHTSSPFIFGDGELLLELFAWAGLSLPSSWDYRCAATSALLFFFLAALEFELMAHGCYSDSPFFVMGF
jgi:hypothetical protein